MNQATLLINTLLLVMACALLSVAVKATPLNMVTESKLPRSTLSPALYKDRTGASRLCVAE